MKNITILMKKLLVVIGIISITGTMWLSFTNGVQMSIKVKATSEGIPIYRVYNPNTGEHFHTMNWNEEIFLEEKGWLYEGISMYVSEEGQGVYRLYNPNTGEHLYTLNWNECENLKKHGWKYEGIAWTTPYVGVPVYRVYNPNASNAGSHHYTTSYGEVAHLASVGWRAEGVSWYASSVGEPYVPVTGSNDMNANRAVTKGVVIHNDTGTLQGSQYRYLESYSRQQLKAGFAHYYVAKGDIYQFWNDSKVAWHTKNFSGNTEYIGVEVTNSMGSTDRFLENEQETFKLVARLLKKYDLPVKRTTVRLHKEFFNTSCPHRSWELHGKSVESVQDYFISQIQKYM